MTKRLSDAEKASTLELCQVSGLLNYDPETGAFTWRARDIYMFPTLAHGRTWNTRYAGRAAFTTPDTNGYLRGFIFDRTYRASRVAWLFISGKWPSKDIDHINGNRSDNRAANLRLVSPVENSRNKKRRKRISGRFTGIRFDIRTGEWTAEITIHGRVIKLGTFLEEMDAVCVRKEAEAKYGFFYRDHV